MENTKKINISALMKKPVEKVQEVQPKNSTLKPNVQKAGVTINVSTIKSDKKPEIVEEIQKVAAIKDEHTLFYESLTSNVLHEGESDIDEKKRKQKQESEKIDKGKEKKCNIDIITDKDGEKKEVCILEQTSKSNIFSNYQSEYQKKQTYIIETIHKLKKLADIKNMTKTNKIFVSGIILTTILGISFLFYIDPDTHSLENYKTSILTLAGREITQENLIQHQTEIQDEITWQLNENNLGGYQLDFEILISDIGNATYKFDGQEYNTRENLDAAIKEKLEDLKQEKIKNFLKEKRNLRNE